MTYRLTLHQYFTLPAVISPTAEWCDQSIPDIETVPMLHMVIVRHSPESCPGRPGNEAVHPCLHAMDTLIADRGIGVVGRWADPAAHVNYMVLDSLNAHVIQGILMESGLFGHTTTEVRPVLSMDAEQES